MTKSFKNILVVRKRLLKKDVYTIASDNSFAPFEFQNTDQKFTGIDVDLLNAIAKRQRLQNQMETTLVSNLQ